MRIAVSIAAALVLAVTPSLARATDMLSVSAGSGQLPVASSGFDWNGFYAGVYGVTQASTAGGMQYGLGLDVGANARLEFVLVGTEVDVEALTGGAGSSVEVQGLGKAGLALSDDLVAYAAGGLGATLGGAGAGDSNLLIGGGLDLAVSDNISLGARYLHGVPISGASSEDQLTVGANFHF